MQISQWNKAVVAGVGLSLAFVMGFNYVVDPYEVFHSGFVKPGTPTNERYNKAEFLLTKGKSFDTLIMGSSVMGAYEPKWLTDITPDKHVYNASFLGGLPIDALKVLKTISANGNGVKEIYMGIDLFPFMQAEDSKSPSKSHHYKVSGESKVSFYSDFLFASSLWHGGNKIMGEFTKVPNIRFDLYGTGRYYLMAQDVARNADLQAYTKKAFEKKAVSEIKVKNVAWIDYRFAELRELVSWCRAHGIKTTFYIHPFHRLLRDNVPSDAMQEFRAKIFAITGEIPDFTTRTELTDNDSLYYDPKHYIPDVAHRIVNETYGHQ